MNGRDPAPPIGSKRSRPRRVLWTTALVAAAVVFAILRPPPVDDLVARPRPARNYGEALARLDALEGEDGPDVAARCRTRAFLHGRRTGTVIVLVHGLTNCPQQFDSLGRMLFRRGANVLIARVPHHGLADRMTPALARLDAETLARHTDEIVDVAAGLGRRVTVAGLSLGGVVAAWAGQEREEVDRAVVIAPTFGVLQLPAWVIGPLVGLLVRLPNAFVWWDPHVRRELPGPPQCYPRFSTRSLAGTMRLGLAVARRAGRLAPRCRRFVIVTIEHDMACSPSTTDRIARRWREHGAGIVRYVFPARLHLHHDLIDPQQVGARVAEVYPVLMRLLQ